MTTLGDDATEGVIGYAVWDMVYFVRDKAVDRSLTECCFLDLGLGVALLLTAGKVLPLQ